MDFLGPLNGSTYFIVVDACSKWVEAVRMKSTTAASVIAVLRDMFARFGLPKQVVSDNGPPFTSAEFSVFMSRNKIEHIFSAPYHPASNGAAENAVKMCKRVLKKAMTQKLDPDTALSRFLLNYRNTEHYTTGDSPAKILQGRNLRMRLDELKPERESRVRSHQARNEQYAGGAHRQLAPGDLVWFRDYRSRDKWLPGKLTERLGTTDYKVKSFVGTEVQRHIDQLRLRTPPVCEPTDSTSRESITFNNNKKTTRSSLSYPSAVETPTDSGSAMAEEGGRLSGEVRSPMTRTNDGVNRQEPPDEQSIASEDNRAMPPAETVPAVG